MEATLQSYKIVSCMLPGLYMFCEMSLNVSMHLVKKSSNFDYGSQSSCFFSSLRFAVEIVLTVQKKNYLGKTRLEKSLESAHRLSSTHGEAHNNAQECLSRKFRKIQETEQIENRLFELKKQFTLLTAKMKTPKQGSKIAQ